MEILGHLMSPDFGGIWLEIAKNASLSFILALPLTIRVKKVWPVVLAVLVGVFAIDIHGYFAVLHDLGFNVQPLKGRTLVNSYGFELTVLILIYSIYQLKLAKCRNIFQKIILEERYFGAILGIAIGFHSNIFVDTTIKNSELFYEPFSSIIGLFVSVGYGEIPKILLWGYICAFFLSIYLLTKKAPYKYGGI